MKIYQCVKSKKATVDTPAVSTVDATHVDVKEDIKKVTDQINKGNKDLDEKIESLGVSIDNILDLMMSEEPEKEPDWYKYITLQDFEMRRLQNYIMETKRNNFPELKADREMPEPFLWTLPKYVYDIFTYYEDGMFPAFVNPAFWVMMMCVKPDTQTYAKLFLAAMESVDSETMKRLQDLAGVNDDDDENNEYEEELDSKLLYVPDDIYEDDSAEIVENEIIDVPPMVEETIAYEAEEVDPENIDINVPDNNDVSDNKTDENNNVEETNNEKSVSESAQ